MRDLGLLEQNEPWKRVFNQGQILGHDGERMSKSRGNTQDPDELIARYGADTIRMFLMFMGPWDQGGPWSPTGIGGVHRFLNRIWTLVLDPNGREAGDPDAGRLPPGEDLAAAERQIRMAAHQTLRTVTAEYGDFKFNTMVSHLMELSNTLMTYRGTEAASGLETMGTAWDEAIRLLLLMLAPAAPHIVPRRLISPRIPVRLSTRSGGPSTRSAGPWSTRPRSPTRRGRSRSRSTARSAIESSSRRASRSSSSSRWSCRATRSVLPSPAGSRIG